MTVVHLTITDKRVFELLEQKKIKPVGVLKTPFDYPLQGKSGDRWVSFNHEGCAYLGWAPQSFITEGLSK